MATDRTAIDTITGYYYQFDYYILELLSRDEPHDTITIEAIEDVDIHSLNEITAVQCKYYAKTEYNHYVIAKPIRLMLKNFKENPASRNEIYYKIYGHFKSGQTKLVQPISIDFLKEKFLSYVEREIKHECHIELGLSNEELQTFLDHLRIDINACEFCIQENRIIRKLKELFQCSEFEAEYYYYNNALRLVRKLAIEQDIRKRAISKTDFIKSINHKQFLFDSWYLEYRGIKEYCKAIKSQYFSTINISPYERFFLIEYDQQISEQRLKALILKISKNWSRLSKKEPRPFCPYVYLHGLTKQSIVNIKQLLQNDNIYFIDGYDFKGSNFVAKSIARKASSNNGIKLKFITQLDQIDCILEELTTTRIIYQFYIDEPFYGCESHQVYCIKIATTQNIEDMI